MRSELGKIYLDKVFQEREGLNVSIVESINKASEAWGISCLRYEIRDIRLPERVHEAMQMQVEAERKKRAAILQSEGVREADINIAEGKRTARILASEAEKQEQINQANGEAEAMLAVAVARAKSLETVAASLGATDGHNAAALAIAEQYIHAFDKLAKTNNTIIIPKNVGDISGFVAQAMTIYKYVAPQSSGSSPQIEEMSHQQADVQAVDNSNDSYEYFSDKEEAENFKRRNRNKSSLKRT